MSEWGWTAMLVLTTNLPPRKRSAAAFWALRLAVFIPVLFVTAIIANNLDMIDTPVFLAVLAVAGGLCIWALILWGIGLRSLWVHGRRGGRRLSWALMLLMPFLLALAAAGWNAATRPAAMQASTDLVDPPVFAAEFNRDGPGAGALVAAKLNLTPSTLHGRRYSAPMPLVLERIGMVAGQARWRLHLQRGRIGADDRVFVEYRGTIPLTQIATEMVIRLADQGDTVLVDVRSRSPDLPDDLGYNRWAIDHILHQIDMAMIGLGPF